MSGRQTRAKRAACPLARDSMRKIAEASGGCLRPVQLRRTDTVTGETVPVMVPCGATLASICPPCAERAKAQRAHADRLAEALRYEPCSPACANWLRFGIQPKNARPGLIPGACKGKAHRSEHCGYAGRRVLVSRKWSGKTLADHRAGRKAWLVATLGLEVPDPARYTWAQVTPGDPDYLPPEQRLLHVVAGRARWKAALIEARRRAGPPTGELSATGRAA